jgi:hypothetical protein
VEKMKAKKYNTVVLSSLKEKDAFKRFAELLNLSFIPNNEILENLGVFLTSKYLSRLLFFYEIYKKIVNKHGVIIEFGVRWGATLSTLSALRGILEPFNRHRKIIGFDTFKGLKGMGEKDGKKSKCKDGTYSLPKGYEKYLDEIMSIQEKLNPMSHLKRYEIIKGDAVKTVPKYFKQHPETMVSLAVFDFDVYKPTKVALQTIKPHLCKGSILVFDELCDDIFPGETLALQEVLGLNNLKVNRFPMTCRVSYVEIK